MCRGDQLVWVEGEIYKQVYCLTREDLLGLCVMTKHNNNNNNNINHIEQLIRGKLVRSRE